MYGRNRVFLIFRLTRRCNFSIFFPISFFEESQGLYVKKSGQSTNLEMILSKVWQKSCFSQERRDKALPPSLPSATVLVAVVNYKIAGKWNSFRNSRGVSSDVLYRYWFDFGSTPLKNGEIKHFPHLSPPPCACFSCPDRYLKGSSKGKENAMGSSNFL